MNCHRFQQRLNQLLDRRSPPDEDRRLCAHAAACPECAAILRMQRDVLQALGIPDAATQRTDLAPLRDRGRRARIGTWAVWAVATSLLIVLLARPGAERQPGGMAGRDHQERVVANSVRHESAELAATEGSWRTAVSITSPLTWGLVVHRAEWAGYDYPPLSDNMRVTGWWRPIEAGLGPLVQSLTSAANVLRSIWPPAAESGADAVSDRLAHGLEFQVG